MPDYTVQQGRPRETAGLGKTELGCYDLLERLGISFERISHPAAATVADLPPVERALGCEVCKNLFLCNRQQTDFYLLLMPGQKEFKTKDLSAQLGVARLSFAQAEPMRELLGVEPGSVSVLGLMNDRENAVRLLIDEQLLANDYLGCHPCANTATLKISMRDVRDVLLPALGHEPTIVSLPEPAAE